MYLVESDKAVTKVIIIVMHFLKGDKTYNSSIRRNQRKTIAMTTQAKKSYFPLSLRRLL